MASDNLINTTKAYYDSSDADAFYLHIWGGEDIHIGIYESPGEPIARASRRTVERMIEKIAGIPSNFRLLDIGAGYGGAARQLALKLTCEVICLNLSEKENARNQQLNLAAGLTNQIKVVQGNFENLPFPDQTFELIWCQDAILHSDRKATVFGEVARVLKPGGQFLLTDPMQSDNCPEGVLDPILKRIHLKEMGSVQLYTELARNNNLTVVELEEMPGQLVQHYSRVREELLANADSLQRVCSREYIQRMERGLLHWIEGGQNGYLNWGIIRFRKEM